MTYKQTTADLKKALQEQFYFLESSANAFDAGNKIEAKRLANTMRLLLHNKGRNESLLSQLNKKDILFYDTSYDYDPNNTIPFTGLAVISIGSNKSEYKAPLGDGSPNRYDKKKLSFDEWWNKIILVDKKNGNKFSREYLILSICDKDGGAHIDSELKEDYIEIKKNNSIGWKFFANGKENPITDIELVSVRQIAYELIKTLRDEFINYSK